MVLSRLRRGYYEVGSRAAAQELLPLSRERAAPPDFGAAGRTCFPNPKDVVDPNVDVILMLWRRTSDRP